MDSAWSIRYPPSGGNFFILLIFASRNLKGAISGEIMTIWPHLVRYTEAMLLCKIVNVFLQWKNAITGSCREKKEGRIENVPTLSALRCVTLHMSGAVMLCLLSFTPSHHDVSSQTIADYCRVFTYRKRLVIEWIESKRDLDDSLDRSGYIRWHDVLDIAPKQPYSSRVSISVFMLLKRCLLNDFP